MLHLTNLVAKLLALGVVLTTLIYAIAVNDGRLHRLTDLTNDITQLAPLVTSNNSQQIQAQINKLNDALNEAKQEVNFGSADARHNIFHSYWLNIASLFHAQSSGMNSFFIAISACCYGSALLPLRKREFYMWWDILLTLMLGILALLLLKGGKSLVGASSAIDSADPYGIALFSAIAGLYSDRFFDLLVPIAVRLLRTGSDVNPPPAAGAGGAA